MKEATKVFMQALLAGETLEYQDWTTGIWLAAEEPLAILQAWEENDTTPIRVAPRTITIGGKELPGPCVEAPAYGESYWFITVGHPQPLGTSRWENHRLDKDYLQSGNVFKTREDAEAVAEHLVSLLTQNHPKTESTK